MSDLNKLSAGIWGTPEEDLQTKASGSFGLNKGFLTKLEISEKNGEDGLPLAPTIDIVVSIQGREYFGRFYMNTEIYHDNNLIGSSHEDYIKAFEDTYAQYGAVVRHALKAVGVTDQAFASITNLKQASTPEELVPVFIENLKMFLSLLPADFSSKPIDIFLEYQWQIKKDNTRTFLVLPQNMKGGAFLCPSMEPVGKWSEIRNDEGLHYIDGAGNKHRFTRDAGYMESPKSYQQIEGEVTVPTTTPESTATRSSWG